MLDFDKENKITIEEFAPSTKELISNKQEKLTAGVGISIDNNNVISCTGEISEVFVGYVTNGDSFPTRRLDGTELQKNDYVRPSSNSTFPFTIKDVTFTTRFDIARYMLNNNWTHEEGMIEDTSETPTHDPNEESIYGTADNQADINKENIKYNKQKIFEFPTASTEWVCNHDMDKFPSVRAFLSDWTEVRGTVAYNTSNTVVVKFAIPVSGRLVVN